MGRDVYFYSISIDPETDQPPQLKAYNERFQIGQGWQFFTGEQKQIDELQDRLLALAGPDKNPQRWEHAGSFFMGSQDKGLWLKRTDKETPDGGIP